MTEIRPQAALWLGLALVATLVAIRFRESRPIGSQASMLQPTESSLTVRRSMFGVIAAIAGLLVHSIASAADPEAVVQAQLVAYNARDLNAFLATYAEDAQLFEHPSKLLASGVAQMRERYAARFAEPNLHAVVTKRIVMGNIVIDHERVARTFPDGTGTQDAIAIYEVQGALITRVWFISGAKTLDPKT